MSTQIVFDQQTELATSLRRIVEFVTDETGGHCGKVEAMRYLAEIPHDLRSQVQFFRCGCVVVITVDDPSIAHFILAATECGGEGRCNAS
jgi:hypothetical protein